MSRAHRARIRIPSSGLLHEPERRTPIRRCAVRFMVPMRATNGVEPSQEIECSQPTADDHLGAADKGSDEGCDQRSPNKKCLAFGKNRVLPFGRLVDATADVYERRA